MSKQITIIGLGAMGIALASKYLEDGYTTTVWNRSTSKATPLVSKGAHLAPTIKEALEASPLIIICVLHNAAVEETLSQSTASLPGKVIVNLTNGTPNQARKLSDWITSFKAVYIHGGIMAVPTMIGSPQSLLLYSSPNTEAFNRVEPDLSLMGTSKYLGSDPGSASLHDLALLSGMCGLFSGFLHATAMAKSVEGTTATGFLELLVPWLSAMMGYLGPMAKQIDEEVYTSHGSNLGMQLVGMENIRKGSEEQGVDSGLLGPLQGLMERAVEGGHAGDDLSALMGFF